MNNKLTISVSKKLILLAVFLIVLIMLVSGSFFAYSLYYKDKIYPNIKIANFPIGNLTKQQAVKYLSQNILKKNKLNLVGNGQEFIIELANIEFEYDFEESVNDAYSIYRTSDTLTNLIGQLKSPITNADTSLVINYNDSSLEEYLSVIAGQLEIIPIKPSVKIIDTHIVVDKGEAGRDVDKNKLRFLIVKNLKDPKAKHTIDIPLVEIDLTINDAEAIVLRERAQNLLDKSLDFEFENTIYSFDENDLLALLGTSDGFDSEGVNLLIEKLSIEVERPAQNSVFNFEVNKVVEFLPAKDGIVIDKEILIAVIIDKLTMLEHGEVSMASIEIPISRSSPDITTEEVNNLGIKELIGKGSSTFRGSIASRIHNIGVASASFNGVLVEPDKTFSFNDILGDVSSFTGYKQAYIIKDGKTVLGDGGGVCQVSTTLFRAALDAGLPIVERRSHSYRVTYYEQGYEPGLDATVYAPTTDLKMKNDTPGHILIQTLYDPVNASLDFEIYGTSDGRVATITTPVITSQSPPPEDLYIDDPTKPTGYIEQTDWAAWGAKTNFKYTVEKDGETVIDKTFYSNFRPWQAKYIRGTGPAI